MKAGRIYGSLETFLHHWFLTTSGDGKAGAVDIMCRWAAYRGEPLFIEELVSSPAHSLIEQSVCATRAKTSTNADGFGLAWYGDRPQPGRFRDVLPAWSDCNLKSIAHQISTPLFLAHVRAATHGATRRDNCHPFVHDTWSFMHNGQIDHFERLRRTMEQRLDDAHFGARYGSTDSELMFLLAMQFGMKERPLEAMAEVIGYVEKLSLDMIGSARVRFTAAFSDGKSLYAVRYSTDAFAPTLYAGPMGLDGGYCLVSEPLTDDSEAWVEIPAGSAVILSDDGLNVANFGPIQPDETKPALEMAV